MKPLGQKAYGSIGHLPLSRMGPADHAMPEGQQAICCEKTRDRHDRVIVTEKLDGSCMAVAMLDGGEIVALSRAGYLAQSSPYWHLQEFAPWVEANKGRFENILLPGERLCGEWLNVATGTVYDLPHDPFVPFDLIKGKDRQPYDEMRRVALAGGFTVANLIHDGGAISVADALERAGDLGAHGALELIEGCVWRVERRGAFEFIAKFVRHDKIDGKYLPGLHGNTEYRMNTWVTA